MRKLLLALLLGGFMMIPTGSWASTCEYNSHKSKHSSNYSPHKSKHYYNYNKYDSHANHRPFYQISKYNSWKKWHRKHYKRCSKTHYHEHNDLHNYGGHGSLSKWGSWHRKHYSKCAKTTYHEHDDHGYDGHVYQSKKKHKRVVYTTQYPHNYGHISVGQHNDDGFFNISFGKSYYR